MNHQRDINGECFCDCPECKLNKITEAAEDDAATVALVRQWLDAHGDTECECEHCQCLRNALTVLFPLARAAFAL
jgi:hypothetical protein